MRVLSGPVSGVPPADERDRFADLRSREFARLDAAGQVYLDFTGAALYARSQVEAQTSLLLGPLLGNPHSGSPASAAATERIEAARADVLAFFGADPDEYTAVFTGNASGAAKLVGEAFPFRPGSRLVLLQDNHNSVNGVRRYAESGGARVDYLPLDAALRADIDRVPPAGPAPSLFAFPAQSNFSGVRHPLELVRAAQERGHLVLLDIAAMAPTSPLELRCIGADFLILSFYKICGIPTGVGALLARREALARLERPWFAGGTVDFVSVQHPLHQLRSGAAGFEDGTPHFLGIASVPAGLAFLRGVGMNAIARHVGRLTGRLLDRLGALRQPDGRPAVRLYGPGAAPDRGGTVAFNLVGGDGRVVPFELVEQAAGRAGIHLRGGCFCNPGAAEAAFGLPAERLRPCLEGLPPGEFEIGRLQRCLGPEVAVGALRASLGVPSDDADVDRLGEFLQSILAG